MKKFFLLSIILIIVVTFFLLTSGCTSAGMDYSLVGTWKGEVDETFTYEGLNYLFKADITFQINSNDTGNLEISTDALTDDDDFTIVKSDSCAKTIKLKFDNWTDYNKTYNYELSCNRLTIKDFEVYKGIYSTDFDLSR